MLISDSLAAETTDLAVVVDELLTPDLAVLVVELLTPDLAVLVVELLTPDLAVVVGVATPGMNTGFALVVGVATPGMNPGFALVVGWIAGTIPWPPRCLREYLRARLVPFRAIL